VAQHRTRLGPCSVMRQNPHNAVLCLGHANGTVSMWTPNISTPVVKMLTHRGPVTALAVDPTGHQLVTAGERTAAAGAGAAEQATDGLLATGLPQGLRSMAGGCSLQRARPGT
jgi:hypothetical protein